MLRNWEPMLAHQLPMLPGLEVYWDSLPEFFDWLEGRVTRESVKLAVISGHGQIYQPSYGNLRLRTRSGKSLEIIRFAAGNRLCVDLIYTDNNGRRVSRVIEPYSLRQAKIGNVLLFAVRADDGKIRSYKIDQINNTSITNRVFSPRYQIELNPSGISVPVMEKVPSTRLGLPSSSRSAGLTTRRSSTRPRTFMPRNNGPTYIFRCPMCDKTFRRKTQNSKLNPHKTKYGWPCSGRMGYYEDTKY